MSWKGVEAWEVVRLVEDEELWLGTYASFTLNYGAPSSLTSLIPI
jgi:hypothetical protein